MKAAKFILTTIIVGCLYFLSGCADTPKLENASDKTESYTTHVSLSEALETAEKTMQDFESAVRSHERRIKDVSVISGLNTRSGANSAESDSLLYVVNYDDNEGFAILGTDTRMAPVYAISPTGQFSLNEAKEDEALSEWLNYVTYAAKESLTTAPNAVVIPGPITITEYRNKKRTGELLPEIIAKFSLNSCSSSTNLFNISFFKVLYIIESIDCYNSARDRLYFIDIKKQIQKGITPTAAMVNLAESMPNISTVNGSSYFYDSGLLVIDNYYDTVTTECNHNSFWNIPLQYHMNQAFKLLTLTGDGMLTNPIAQPFIVANLNNTKTESFFVIDGALYQNKYVYNKITNELISGPTPENWFHCVWGKATSNNGYYLYLNSNDTFEELESSTSGKWVLRMFGGLSCNLDAGM